MGRDLVSRSSISRQKYTNSRFLSTYLTFQVPGTLMQHVQRWGRASIRLPLWLSRTGGCSVQKFRYISSIPKDIQHRDSNANTEDGTVPTIRMTSRQRSRRKEYLNRLNEQDSMNQRTQKLHNDRDIVDPLSLEKTLQAHQRANEESIMIKHVQTISPVDLNMLPVRETPYIPTVAVHLGLEREVVQEGKGQWEDYKGKPRPLSLDWEVIGDVSRRLKTPWMTELDKREGSRDTAAARLTEEIRCADIFFSPSQEEWKAVNQAVKQLETYVLQANPAHTKLDIVGSRASGLATPLSDLDLNLIVSNNTEDLGDNAKVVLGKLFREMRWGSSPNPRPFNVSYFASRARVPIIVGTHNSGLEFQIQSASSCYGSLEVTKGLCAEYPTMRALFKIIKQMLKMRGLTDGSQGGLTSYPLINMIAVTLKKHAMSADPFNYGQHLLHFLEYWSTIDLYTTGITHIPGNSFKEKDTTNAFASPEAAAKSIALITQDPVGAKPIEFDVRKNLPEIHEGQNNFMMTLHDPANPHNDLGRSAFAIKHIQSMFMEVLARLKADMQGWDARIKEKGDAGESPPSLLKALIEGDYSLYNMERKRITKSREAVEIESDEEVDVPMIHLR